MLIQKTNAFVLKKQTPTTYKSVVKDHKQVTLECWVTTKSNTDFPKVSCWEELVGEPGFCGQKPGSVGIRIVSYLGVWSSLYNLEQELYLKIFLSQKLVTLYF